MTHATRALHNHTSRAREFILDGIHTFLTLQGHGVSYRMRDLLNAGATSEITRTWKTIYIIYPQIHPYMVNMEGWLWRPNDIRRHCGPKASWHLSCRWGKTPKKPHPGELSLPGIETGPATWEARLLSHAPQQWALCNSIKIKKWLHQCEFLIILK